MSDVTAIATQSTAQSQAELDVKVQVSVLKDVLDLRKETAKQLLEMFGLGKNVDLQA